MSVELLDKTRRINRLLQDKMDKNRVIFNDLCKILSEELDANIFVISKKGKVLGSFTDSNSDALSYMIESKVGSFIDTHLNERMSNILSTKENVNLETLGFRSADVKGLTAIVSPILISGKRLGHLFIFRNGSLFSIDDIIISEYGSTVIGLETMRSEKEEVDLENTKKNNVEMAMGSMSASEILAIKQIIKSLDGNNDGIVVASRIADQIGITRSIIVNALRKFESAGLIYSHSSGMKGTYLKITNEYLLDFLKDK